MKFSRLVLGEAEKLARAPVFWVAPLVLTVYIFLMLFGYEVYAAKNGTEKGGTVSITGQMTGSAVVSFYAVIKRMARNTFGLDGVKAPNNAAIRKKNLPAEEQKAGEKTRVQFDFLKTFFHNLANPKPMPAQPDGCNCPCPHSENAGEEKRTEWLNAILPANAFASETIKVPPPPTFNEEDTFAQRLGKRLQWLTDPVELADRLIDRSRFNGMRFAYLSFYFASIFIFPLICLAVVGHVFAAEISRGTIRATLLRPVRRDQVLMAKLLVTGGYLLALMVLFVVMTLVIGCVFAGYGNLVVDSELFGTAGQNSVILADGAVMLFAAAAVVGVFSLLPLAAFGILLSFLKPEPAYVIGLSSIIYFMLYSLGTLPLFDDIRWLFFTTYMDGWWLLFQNDFTWAAFTGKLAVAGFFGITLLYAVGRIFAIKDIVE